MSDSNGQGTTSVPDQCSYASFICSGCDSELSITISEAFLLADGQSVVCQSCKASVEASAYDQGVLVDVHKDQVKVAKFILPFSVVWFSVSFLVAIFIKSQVSFLMLPVGLIIVYAIKSSSKIVSDAICLVPVNESGLSTLCE